MATSLGSAPFTLAILGLLAIVAQMPAAPPAEQLPASSKPNIVFILADDLGFGDLSCYGQKQFQTPHIDRLAAQGTRFTNFYAGSTVCAPSRCVLMTGLHTGHCLIRGNGNVNLRPEDVTVAELLHAAGYRTALVGKWGLGQEKSPGVPTRKGFDAFFGYLDQAHAHNYYPTYLLRNENRVPLRNVVPKEGPAGQGVATQRIDYSPDLMTKEALAFVEANKSRPFFLELAYTLPHANNEAGNKGMEVPDLGAFRERNWPEPQKGLAAMIAHLDNGVGQLLDQLKELGLEENTLVLFSSDNGPHKEGGNDPAFFHSSGGLRGIKRALYEGGIRVPFIARWPGHVPAGRTSDYVGWFADFLPTAADLADAPAPPNLDGLSLKPLLTGNAAAQVPHRFLYWEFYERGSAQAVREPRWKGVCQPMDGPIELYDLQLDPMESHNVAARNPDVVARIRQEMREAHVPSALWKK
ncbi:MAG TPA: arylsulfatase [Gemmataceae bacterium]|jgi:arylsulfatase A-like enzyme|nr:arylsulfatase [Gemmataceae bacterium]